MQRYSLQFFDRHSLLIDSCASQASDVGQAMGDANRRIDIWCRIGETMRLDPRGRVDVLDVRGTIVARIYCAEAILALS